MRNSLRIVALVLSAFGAAGCASAPEVMKATTKIKATDVRIAEGKERLLVVSGKSAGGIFYTRPPYQLFPNWRVELTAGIFDSRKVAATGTSSFSLEIDLLGAGKFPIEFYSLGAARFEAPAAGLNVQARSHGGLHGSVFLAGATVADFVVETNGTTVTYLVRDAAVGGAYRTVATTPLGTPAAPHYPAFGVFGMAKGGQVGFTNFRIPQSGPPPVPQAAELAALQDVYGAALSVLEAVYALDGPTVATPDAVAADGFLASAEGRLAAARTKIDALVAKKKLTAAERALAAVDQAAKDVGKARAGLQKKGAKYAKPFLAAAQSRMFKSAFICTDALLPQDLRDKLPGNGLKW